MGDHGVFSVMPQLSNNYNDYVGRALPFSHENEIAHPDYYAVKFDNGIMGEIVPSSHSAIFRFTFPNENSLGSLIIDTPNSTDGDPQINNDDFTMVVNNGGTGNTYGATPMYVYGKFSKPISSKVDRCATFNLNEDKTLQIKIATSFISNIQARHNFDLEIGDPNLSFDQLRQKATQT
jgi:putative alpha-1,2-mannosidase